MRRFLICIQCCIFFGTLSAQEICDNGIDDDGDGWIDLNDSDCSCSGISMGILTEVPSLIPNPSFEDTLCCPDGPSQLECTKDWQSSSGSSDYYHACGAYYSHPGYHPPAYPFPDGSGYAGFFDLAPYSEMIGVCLTTQMEARSVYAVSLFVAKSVIGDNDLFPMLLSLYGTSDCSDLPWNAPGCPIGRGSWMLLGVDTIEFVDSMWYQAIIQFDVPNDIHALAIGGSCEWSFDGPPKSGYYYIDELTVTTESTFDFNAEIIDSGKWCTGDLHLTADIDTPGGSWQWYRGGIALSGETFAVLDLMPYGTDFEYTAVYTLGDNCVSIDHTVDTTDPANRPRALAILNNDTTVCEGAVITVNATATPGHHFQWSPTTGVSDSTSLTPDITAGTDTGVFYTVTASYPGCPDTMVGFRISMQSIPQVDLGNDTIVCRGDLVPLMALIEPYRADYAYAWSPDAGLQFDSTANNYFPADSNVTYHLTVSTPIGCSGADSLRIEVQPDSFAAIIADTGYCPPNAVPLWANGGSSYRWAPAYGLDNVHTATPMASPETPTTYSVYVRSDYGCRDTAWVFIDVYPNAVINLPDTITIYPGERYHLQVGTNALYFDWFPTSGISNTRMADPYFYPEVRTRYFVTATTEHGCVIQDSIDIQVKGTVLDLPNAFHPGNGSNNVFKVEKRGVSQLNSFVIYNRWGNKVFETRDITQGWDGTYNEVPQPLGVYVYLVDAITVEGERVVKQGNVTLVK